MTLSGSKPIRFGIVALLALLIFNGLLSYRAVLILRQRRAAVRQTYESRQSLEQLFSLLKDAETGQRGFLYTGDDQYLKPYNDALPQIKTLSDKIVPLFSDSQANAALESDLRKLMDQKLQELSETIALKRVNKLTQVREVVDSGTGRALMDSIRTVIARMEAEQEKQLSESVARQQEADAYLVATLAFASAAAFMFVLLFAAALGREARRVHELQNAEKLATTGRMAATVAHEINNPLEAATNLIYLAATNKQTPEMVKEMLDLADKELARVAHMTKQTLGFYRSATADQPFSVPELMDEMVRLFDSKLQGKNISVRRQFAVSEPMVSNRGEIFQVMTNLFSNAIDASPNEGVVTLGVTDDQSGITMFVEDEGAGIPKDVQQRMFDAFVTTKKDVGTGLGLWVAEKLVSKHGGRINVKSGSPGMKGSRFIAWLPKMAKKVGEGSAASSATNSQA